jgi:putative ABC transport system permease protein
LHSFINVFGLSIGILFTLVISAYVWGELRVNKNLRNAGNQYFLKSEWKDPNLGPDITTLAPLAKRLKEDYPNLVANYYRWDGISSVVSKNGKYLRENIQLGDSTLLSMYGFQLLYGNGKTALTQPFSAVITPEVAVKYFGKTDVVGETFSIQSFSGTEHEFIISGVLKNLPENSVTQLNDVNHNQIFIPINTSAFFGRMGFDSWLNIYTPSYIELRPGITANDLKGPIRQLINQNTSNLVKQNLVVKPVALTDYYLNQGNGFVKRMLYTLSFVGLFILMMAVINFVNISISSASRRMKEIGMRKVLGGLKKQIVFQLLTESILIVLVATAVALATYSFIKDFFTQITGKELPAVSSFSWVFSMGLVFFVLIVGAMAGLYPALVLASLNSVDSLKGKLSSIKEKTFLRRSLVGFQIAIATIVMIAALVVSQQVSYFFSQSLGYDKEYLVSSQVPRDWSPEGTRKMITVRNEFASMPQVASATLSYEIPNGNNGSQSALYKLGTDSTQAIAAQSMITDENYLSTYQIPLKSGAFFSGNTLDSAKVILNERAVQALGYKTADDAVGRLIRIPGVPTIFTIKGVVKDFHFSSMQVKIEPLVFFNVESANAYRFLSFKIKPGNIGETIDAITKKWSELLPGSAFEYNFMDDALKKLYASELKMKKAAYAATVLSLVIVMLGILGLLSISIQKRMKEIGIRKVLGASFVDIIALFLKEFLLVLAIGILVAIPVSWMLMKNWLDNYEYRIHLTVQPFLFAITALAMISVLLISLRIVKASSESPVKSLKTE